MKGQGMSDTPKVAAIYARVSTEDQGRGFSLPTQIDACKALARQEGYLVPEGYIITDDVTGKTLDRLGLRKLRALVHTNSITALIVYDPDRLSRNLGHQLLLAEESEKAGIALLVVSHPMEHGPEGWLFFQMRGALAEYERAKILERTKRGAMGRISAGHPWGGAVPLGYRYVAAPHAGRWEVETEEAALVQRIFAMCLSGMPARAIARALTTERIPTPSDRNPKRTAGKRRLPAGVWGHPTIRGILCNETYRGTAYWGKREQVTATTRRARPASEWLAFTVPSIIDSATFEAAQVALRRHKAIATQNRKHDYLFAGGRLRCGHCGRSMTGIWRRGGRRYYICSSHNNVQDPALRCSGSLRADVAETQVWNAIVRLLEQPEMITAEVAKQEASADEQRAALHQEEAVIEAALLKCDKEITRWNDAYASDVINLEELKAYRTDIAERRQSLLAHHAACQTQRESISQATGQVKKLIDYCVRVRQRLQTFDATEKGTAMEALDIRVHWTRGEPLGIQGCIPLDPIVVSASGSNSRESPAGCDSRHGGADYPHSE
jgi:site-specific DNA recombinase